MEWKRVEIEQRAQFDQLFANLEEYTDSGEYEEDKYTEVADLVIFYNLTNFIFKMVSDVTRTQITGPIISYSSHMPSLMGKYINKINREHELNYDTNAELKDFSNEYIQKPFGRPIYDGVQRLFNQRYVEVKKEISV